MEKYLKNSTQKRFSLKRFFIWIFNFKNVSLVQPVFVEGVDLVGPGPLHREARFGLQQLWERHLGESVGEAAGKKSIVFQKKKKFGNLKVVFYVPNEDLVSRVCGQVSYFSRQVSYDVLGFAWVVKSRKLFKKWRKTLLAYF